MNTLITLVKMQLKEKLNFRELNLNGKAVSHTVTNVLFMIVKFIFATLMCSAVFLWVGILPMFSFSTAIPDTFMAFLFSLMLLLSVFSCTVRLTKAMYFSRDNTVLLTLPCTPTQVYLSKIIVFFLFELKKNVSFLVPMFVGYFITQGHEFIFYPWLIICFFLVSLLTVAIGAFLSIPAMWIATIFRQRKSLHAIATVLLLTVATIALFYAMSLIPENESLDLRTGWTSIRLKVDELLSAFAVNFSLLYDLCRLITGEFVDTGAGMFIFPIATMLVRLAFLILASAATICLGVLVVNPIFYTMASKPFEYLKAAVAPRKNRVRGSVCAPIYTEMVKSFKDSTRTAFNVGLLLSTPTLVFFLNKLFAAMPTNDFGDKMIISFNILIILLVALNSNSHAASIFSRDGRSAYLIKVQPKNPTALLVAKLLPTAIFCVGSFVATSCVLLTSSNLTLTDVLFLMLGVLFIYLAHLLYSAELDIINPHTEVYAAIGEYENDPNELKSSSLAFLLSFLIAGATILLLFEESIASVCPKLAIVGLLAFAYRAYLFFTNIKLYYKEK